MPARAPRLGFFAYAALLVVASGLGFWQRHLVAAAIEAHEYTQLDHVVSLLAYAYIAADVASVLALLAVSTVPRSTRVAGIVRTAAVLAALGALLQVVERVVLSLGAFRSVGASPFETFLLVMGGATTCASVAKTVLILLAIARVGRAAGARAAGPAVAVALVLVCARTALYVVSARREGGGSPALLETAGVIAFYASQAIVAGLCVAAGILVARLPVSDTPAASTPPGDMELPPAWRSPAEGIGLYLGGAAARIGCALLGYLVLASAGGATSTSDFAPVRSGILVVAVLSGATTLAMLGGVWRISRAPQDSGASAPALLALGFMIMGWTLDVGATSITYDALGGRLSAAFFAMDALPVIALLSVLLGIGAGVALLQSFRNMASAIGVEALAARARSTSFLLIATGGVAGLAVLGLTKMPPELLLLFAVFVLPLAAAVLVQFLRVAVPLGRAIRSRLPAP